MISFTNTSESPIIEDGIITVLSGGLTLEPNGYEVVDTGVSIDVPEGHIIQVVNDFDTLSRNVIVTVVGDSPVYVKIQNLGLMPLTVDAGDTLVKLIVMSYIPINIKENKEIKFIEFQDFPKFEDWLMMYLIDRKNYLLSKIKPNLRSEFASILMEARIIYGYVSNNYIQYIINMSHNYIIDNLRSIYEKEKPKQVKQHVNSESSDYSFTDSSSDI